jgi:hypothetical protein
MSNEQLLNMIMKRLDEHQAKLEKHDGIITKILIAIGSMKVKVGMIVGIFSTIGGILTAIVMKYVLNF